ncbi:FAD-dependent oxidoreductase [Aliifodinibius sp. S!AR15-10]|uniref:FAD-dependent oxidoreductase n=1 Tax=Aliifodinibius sp. S!AR15-10 TaxID=2950437 RepID=UPI00285EE828|nr:FAD-dependent oxidoreductase [Aliifodinibius sp. S!AR15-10]MDR8391868.1 FAD-dependent oxidoreductase [Aliifodinibius sp. S!AR15-10]
MDRQEFLTLLGFGGLMSPSLPGFSDELFTVAADGTNPVGENEFSAEVIIAGGGLGGCAAALASLRNGLSVIMTEETEWIGGQLTQQGVPPDEHQWIESHGATKLYRKLRTEIRNYYRQYYPLVEEARNQQDLNPGNCAVSRIGHEPRVALAVLYQMFAPYLSSGKLTLLIKHKITGADVSGDFVRTIEATSRKSGEKKLLSSPYFVDATELGELLPRTGTEYVTGAESKAETGELHAADTVDHGNQQAPTWCFAMDYVPGTENLIEKPEEYEFWRDYVPDLTPPWPGKLLSLTYSNPATLEPRTLGFHPYDTPPDDKFNLWIYRRIIDRNNFKKGFYPGDITIVNWPQNDFLLGNLVDVSDEVFEKHLYQARQLSLSLFYWLQTEVPRPDGGQGWPGLRLRGDVMGTGDGLAKYPYIRESRRIKAVFTVLEEHVGRENRAMVTGMEPANVEAAKFYDSVGVGYYRIDLHPSSAGDNYIDFESLPFQIPLGALLPQRINNLLPANKNIGTTHITNGCYRLHPVEWNIGESVGMLVAFALDKKVPPREIRADTKLLEEFQKFIRSQGIETDWPKK